MSPEQAVNPKFKAILRDPEFHDKLGLFAIDELHIVGAWRDFREDFTYLYTLRSLLPRSVPWFGCTATLDRDNQDFILKHAGFDLQRLKIIRTSVDRPEISIIVQPLVRGYINDYRRLHYLLADATTARVRDIPKTIIYIDSKPRLIEARWSLCKFAQEQCGFSKEFARKVIQRFDADVRDTDKDIIFNNLATHTDCRIVLATVSLGLGMDIPDVIRVVQFGLPKTPSLSDLVQRFRRAMRNAQKTADKGYTQGSAVVFVPYWAFSHLGSTDKPTPKAKQPRRRQPARSQARQQPHTPAIASRLRQMVLVDRDDDDVASQGSEGSQAQSQTSQAVADAAEAQQQEDIAALSSQGLWDFETRAKWSKNDLSSQERLDPVIKAWLNSGCFRQFALDYLQEPDDPDLEYKRPVDKEVCCNGHNCNRTLGRIPPLELRNKGQEKPTTGSLAAFAMETLSAWCAKQAQQLVPAEHRHFDIVGEMWMDIRLQYSVARLFAQGPRNKQELPFHNTATLIQKLPALRDWEYLQSHGPELVALCRDSVATVFEVHQASKKKKAAERAARRSSGPGIVSGSGIEAVSGTDEGRNKRAAEPAVSPAPKR